MSLLVACGAKPSNKPDPTVPVGIAAPKGPVGLAPVDNGVWVVSSGDNSITKVSASGRRTEKVDASDQSPARHCRWHRRMGHQF